MRQRRGCWMRNDSCGDAEGWLSAAARGLFVLSKKSGGFLCSGLR